MSQIIHDISSPNDNLGDALRTAFENQNTMNAELYNSKVDKITGKGLSSNDYTDSEKLKLENIQADAEKNVQPDFLQEDDTQDDYIKNKPLAIISLIYIKRFAGLGQDYILPTNAIAIDAYVDGYIQYIEQTGFEADLNTFTQTEDTVTFKMTIENDSQILIKYYI